MSAKSAAVFGAAGKLGRHVLARLQQQGYTCRALAHRTPVPAEVATISGDIADLPAVEEVMRGADVVVQMATAKEDATTFFEVGIRGTFNVLEACRRQKVRQLILIGGDAALGIWFYPQPAPLDENSPRRAYPGFYAFSKVLEEVMAEQYGIQYGVPTTVLRCSWVFEGDDLLNHFSILRNVRPGEEGHGFGAISPQVRELVAGGEERIPILTDQAGVPLRRHIVHIDDVMQAFVRTLGNPSALGQTFNIAGPAAFDYRVAADYLSAQLAIPTVELRCPDYHSFEINIARARSVLGYSPENDFFRMADRAITTRHS